MKESNYLYLVYLLIIGVVFYLINVLTPLFCDDWHYNFIYGTNTQIKNIGDVFFSQYLHYFNMNGRFVPHFFVQLFDGLLGKKFFNVVNTFMFVALIYLISYTLRKEYKSFYISSSLALFLLFFFIPAFNNCFLWMSGACNYLWVAVLLLLFNIVIERDINNKWMFPFLFIFGIICGWSNEAAALGLGFGYLLYYIFNRKELLFSRVIALIGFFIGLLFLILAPGSVNRAIDKGHITFELGQTMHNMFSSLIAMDNIKLFPCLIILLLLFSILDINKFKLFFKNNLVWMIAIAVSFVFVLWTRHDSGQSRFGFEFFSLILILKLLSSFAEKRTIACFCNLLVLSCACFVLSLSYRNYKDYRNCLYQISKNKDGIILTNPVKYPSYFERFLVFYKWPETMYQYSPYDEWIQRHYHKDFLCFIPQQLYYDIIENPKHYQSFNMSTNDHFYIKSLNSKKVHQVILELNKTDLEQLPFYIRPFANKLERYKTNELLTERYAIICVNGNPYIMVNKNPMVDNRLKEIIIE